MDAKSRARFEARARVVKAMSHRTRLFIVDALSRRERCVWELTDMVGSDISTVSRHLKILRDAGIVDDRREGPFVVCRLRMPCVTTFLECVEKVLRSSAAKQSALAGR